ncbi:hypothetical protein scyTo_0018674, partial [Scyliorhinus torazame]|nr:hypothetical protein [Scyliorhinus torazame]
MALGFLMKLKILWALNDIEKIYFPILAAIGVPINVVTIVVICR